MTATLPLDISAAELADADPQLWIADADIADYVVLYFKAHPHINNVTTHIGRGDWQTIHAATLEISAGNASGIELSAIGQNMVQLLWAERCVTGKMIVPQSGPPL